MRYDNKTKETYTHILTPQERSMHLVLRHRWWLVGMSPFTGNFGPHWLPPQNGNFQATFACSASAV